MVQISAAVVSDASETIRHPDPGPGQVLFTQSNHLTVAGTFGSKPLEGTLDYSVQVLLPGAGAPAEFLEATTQSATFTSNRGDLSSETSWYALPVIGFECLDPDPIACIDHNAVVFAFGAGTGSFGGLSNNALWTLRAAPHGADGEDPVVTVYPERSATVWNGAGTMSGVVGEVGMGEFGDFPPDATYEALMLGGPWGELTGRFGAYRYALVRTYNVTEGGEFPIGTRTLTPDSSTAGILAVY